MIVATAGHVDHGKTSLVRALTGVDTDRLAEEKRRGLSIDLGFAYAALGGAQPVGFVDVPGHERFLRNMLAGVAAIDFALLVVAADDGPMPQTLEHLAILGLLGVGEGAVALTKVDRVPAQRLAQVRSELAEALAKSPLRDAPVFPVVATTGEGVGALRAHLAAVSGARALRPASGNFRLAIDRGFTLPGAGLVVTGAVFSGAAAPGDTLVLSPQGVEVRVRSIHAQGRPAELARAGQRCALNLAGAQLRRVEVQRGQWLVAARAHAPTQRLDVRVVLPGSAPRPMPHQARLQMHHGAGAFDVQLALLERGALGPGETAFAQLVVDEPLSALRGDRFVLRDPSARLTLGGGVILDPFAVARGRSSLARRQTLQALLADTPQQALSELLGLQPEGVELDRFALGWNLDAQQAAQLADPGRVAVFDDGGIRFATTPRNRGQLTGRLIEALRVHHADKPASLGPDASALAGSVGMRRSAPLLRAVLRALLSEGQVVREGPSLRLAQHRPVLAAQDAALVEQVRERLVAAGLRAPIVGELATALGTDRASLLEALERIARLGHLARVAPNRFYLHATVDALVEVARSLAAESADGSFDAAAYRDRSGIGRNLTIEVLEYLDRSGHTRFVRGRRWMAGSLSTDPGRSSHRQP